MRQSFRIETDDGSVYEVDADARDIRAWEAAYGLSYFASPLSYTEITQVAYEAGKRTGAFDGRYPSYKDFDAHAVAVTGVRPVVAADPTSPEATDGR